MTEQNVAEGDLAVWMDPIELSQLHAVLFSLEPKHVLEWGSGGSTRHLLARCPFIERYVSVEHDRAWFENVRAKVSDPRLTLHHAAPDRPLPPGKHSEQDAITWNARAEHEPELMRSYVELPRGLGLSFDFVLVDGRARRLCIREGFGLLRAGGVLMLHDAQRTDYHDALRAVGDPVFLEPWKQGQLCLVRKRAS